MIVGSLWAAVDEYTLLRKRTDIPQIAELLNSFATTITDIFVDFLIPSKYDAAVPYIAAVICGLVKTPSRRARPAF